jgi:hypothetical protein
MSQKQIERPQEKKPRPGETGPQIKNVPEVGDIDELLAELDIVEHPEKYTEAQRECGCLRPSKLGWR